MNDRGFLAMMDALLFITVIIVASSVVAGMSMGGAHDDSNASGLLDSMISSEVRLSDLSEGDDSVVRLSDLMALHAFRGSNTVSDYVSEILETYTGGAPYLFTVEYTDPSDVVHETSIGIPGDYRESTERTAPVSTGGFVRVTLSVLR